MSIRSLRGWIWFLLPLSLSAQSRTDESSYLYGKELLRNERYAEAVTAFTPLAVADPQNKLAAYAHYFLGLAAFRTADYDRANLALLRLTEAFPRWPELGEAYYLLGLTAFERGKPELALRYLAQARGRNLTGVVPRARAAGLAGVATDTLRTLYRDFPDDDEVAVALARRLAQAPATADNRRLLDELRPRLPAAERNLAPAPPRRKQQYNVAALLPFSYLEVDPDSPRRDNQFVIDLYEGMRLAAAQLRNDAGEPLLNLYVYDTERRPDKVRQLAQLPEMRSMDLLLGPVYTEGSLEMAELSRRYRIPMVNPLATNGAILTDNPYALLSESTPEGQAGVVSRFALTRFPTRTAVIVSGADRRDTALAAAYRRAFTAAGGRVLATKQVGRVGAAAEIKALLRDYSEGQVGHLFVTSPDPTVAASVVTTLELTGRSTPVIAPGDWLLDATMISFEQWERRGIYFLFPNYVDADREQVQEFRRAYQQQVRLVPSVFAYQGYDLLFFLGSMVKKYGPQFIEKLAGAGFQPGETLAGYDYTHGRDNGFVPLLRVEDGRLRVVNLPGSQR